MGGGGSDHTEQVNYLILVLNRTETGVWGMNLVSFFFPFSHHCVTLGFSQLGIWLPFEIALKFDIVVKLCCCVVNL